jgi:hypothetical protein
VITLHISQGLLGVLRVAFVRVPIYGTGLISVGGSEWNFGLAVDIKLKDIV